MMLVKLTNADRGKTVFIDAEFIATAAERVDGVPGTLIQTRDGVLWMVEEPVEKVAESVMKARGIKPALPPSAPEYKMLLNIVRRLVAWERDSTQESLNDILVSASNALLAAAVLDKETGE